MTHDQPRDDLLDELAEDFARRWREGEHPLVEEYAQRYPEFAEEIRAVLPAVVLMEQLKPSVGPGAPAAAPADSQDRAPWRLGEYRIVREIGRGGMGVVYEAEQEALGRRVAIKVLPRRFLGNESMQARFRRESRAAARLHHTNIVPVFGVGESNEHCFYVMQLIDGRGLDQVIQAAGADKKTRTLTPGKPAHGSFSSRPDSRPKDIVPSPEAPGDWCRQAAGVGVQVADALAYAHTQGVLHRDIKPSNLLLDGQGAVWVTDFGVARLVEEARVTQSGELVGTLKYMAPEQFSGQSDERCDVYSLGVTLYELLTLRSAFPDTTPQHLIQLITHEAPVSPRKWNPNIPRDLETIVLKAAARERAHRYQTAGELADDLRRFLDDRPIVARRAGPGERLWRWCRRNPALAASMAIALLLMVAVTVISVASYRVTARALAAETTQRRQAEETSALALDTLNRIYDRFAPTRLVVTPQAANAEGVELPPQPALPPEAVALLEDLLQPYEQIAHSGEAFPRLHMQAAEANHRIGDIRKRLGRFEDAAAAYRTAIDLYGRLPLDAADGAVRIKLARAYNELGWTLRTLQKPDEADRMYEQAMRALAEAPGELASRPECRYELARASLMFGQRDVLIGQRGPGPGGRHPGGPGGPGRKPPPDRPPGPPPGPDREHPAQRAAALLQELVAEFPKVPEYRHLLACCYRDIPPERFGRGQGQDRSNTERAIELLEQLVADFPRVPDYRLDLCETLARPCPPERREPNPDSARSQRLEKAIALSQALVAEYPNVPDYAAAHARYLVMQGVSMFLALDRAQAEMLFRKALEVQHKLVKQYPEVVAYNFGLGMTERDLGRVLCERREWKEAQTHLVAATVRLEAVGKKDRRLGECQPLLGLVYRDLGQALNGSGELTRAAVALRKSKDLDADRAHDPFRPRERDGRRP